MYDPKKREFIRTYVKAINEGNAAIFAGAGLSRPAGYVNWKDLMKEVAEDLDLNIDMESDLIGLAQYHVNEFEGRGKINQILVEEFTKDVTTTENHKILSDLPINTFWTTNYDNLIENNLRGHGKKKVDVKIVPENLSQTTPGTDAIVYKMHGDSSLSHDAVLTKDDYEEYDKKRNLFSTALQGDLVSKTFLFIGFSFDDPNLSYILSRIKILLGENSRNHYCFMKRIIKEDYKKDEEYHYAQIKQDLRIKDLKRYKINVLLVDSYEEITEILQHIHNVILRKNIFISGSATEFGDWGEQKTLKFSANLSKEIIKNNNIISGFGLGIGSSIIAGSLEELYQNNETNIGRRLKAQPFPQSATGEISLKEMWTKYRKDMLFGTGIAIFIFGNKKSKESEEIIEADGMFEEFEIAISNGSIPIPVGATGFASQTLWERVMNDFEYYVDVPSLKPLYNELGNSSLSEDELLNNISEIVKELTKLY